MLKLSHLTSCGILPNTVIILARCISFKSNTLLVEEGVEGEGEEDPVPSADMRAESRVGSGSKSGDPVAIHHTCVKESDRSEKCADVEDKSEAKCKL